jgi:ribosomal protein L29
MAEKTRVAFSELIGMPATDLRARLDQLRQELWQHRVKATEGAAPQTHRPGQLRRQIARIMTAVRQQHSHPSTARRSTT